MRYSIKKIYAKQTLTRKKLLRGAQPKVTGEKSVENQLPQLRVSGTRVEVSRRGHIPGGSRSSRLVCKTATETQININQG